MNLGGFSWRRFIGVSAFKSKISRTIGIPLTRSGRQRKLGAMMEQAILIVVYAVLDRVVGLYQRMRAKKRKSQ